jgi:hypothetical protein
LREGGSLPAIVEADDDGLYVLKFRGAGQGIRALIAELVAGEIGRAIGLPVPELVLAEVDPDLARTEPDPEIFSLVKASAGSNLALDYLPSAVAFDPLVEEVDADLASRIVWFDAYVTNVDRTVRNTNMLMWHRRLWLIDHGATLYVHHTPGWTDGPDRSRDPFVAIKTHVLLRRASRLREVDVELADLLTPAVVGRIVDMIPGEWLTEPAESAGVSGGTDSAAAPHAADGDDGGVGRLRDAYRGYLLNRLDAPRSFVEEAIGAR